MIRILLVFIYTTSLYATHLNLSYSTASVNQFNKKDTLIAMDLWVKEIMKDTEHTMSFSYYDNTSLMAKKMKNREEDIVMTSGLEFVKYFDKSNLSDGFTGGRKNREKENLVIVVHKESSKLKLLALTKPRISVQKNQEVAEIYAEYYFLKNLKKVNMNFTRTTKNNTALLKVFFKNVDAAVIMRATFDLAKELNPQIGNNLKIIEYTDICAGSFGFFRSDIDPEVRNKIFVTAFDITKNERGKKALGMFLMDELVETKVTELAPIENLYNEYNRLKIQGNQQ